MKWHYHNFAIVTILAALLVTSSASACPFCKEALDKPETAAAIVGRDDPLREQRAYNYSIYVMVAMPYLLLGTVGFLVYRTMKQAAIKGSGSISETEMEPDPFIAAKGEPPCQPPSAGDNS